MKPKEIRYLMKLPRTDEGNALRLRYMLGSKWKYLSKYKNWMYWDGHCWEGRKTADLCWAAKCAFQQLAMEIYRLPIPFYDEAEQEYRVAIIAWLTKSQIDYHTTMAVRQFKEMLLEEAAAQ